MSKYIQKIIATQKYTGKKIEIDLKGKNLIITGRNGSGKTQLINQLAGRLIDIICRKKTNDPIKLKENITSALINLTNYDITHPVHNQLQTNHTQAIADFDTVMDCQIEMINEPGQDKLKDFVTNYHENRSFLGLFPAFRQADINQSTVTKYLPALKNELKALNDYDKNNNDKAKIGNQFEQYLVALKVHQAINAQEDKNDKAEQQLVIFLEKIEKDFNFLFEDDALKLKFIPKEYRFYILQEGKEPYTLQSLSSGFSAILNIYADLVTKIGLLDLSPDEVTGVVLIDEIDVHLHVSLQKKIFSFFSQAFPKIQFIVTTHSPFVVTSVNDAVIYDLSTYEQVEDLSMYSYTAVMEELFNVQSASNILQDKINKLHTLCRSGPDLDLIEIGKLVESIKSNESQLDNQSLFFFRSAEILLSNNKHNKEG